MSWRRSAETGLAYDLEEQDLGVCAVSAPIFGPDGDVRAAITVVAPAERFGPRAREELAASGQGERGRHQRLPQPLKRRRRRVD